MKRNLFFLFSLLMTATAVWADDYTVTADTWRSNNGDAKEYAAVITLNTPGKLSEALASITTSGQLQVSLDEGSGAASHQATIVRIKGALNSADLTTLASLDAATIDLQDAYYMTGETKTAFTLANPNVVYLILPDDWTKAEVTAMATTIAAVSGNKLASAYSIGTYDQAVTTTRYSYMDDADNDGTEEKHYYDGTRYKDGDDWKADISVPVSKDLTLADGWPKYYYTNTYNRDEKVETTEANIIDTENDWGQHTYTTKPMQQFNVALTREVTYKKTSDGSALNDYQVHHDEEGWYYLTTIVTWEDTKNYDVTVVTTYTYKDPFTNATTTLDTETYTPQGEEGAYYATIDFGSGNTKTFNASKEWKYTYKDLNGDPQEVVYTQEATTITLSREFTATLTAEETTTHNGLRSVNAYINQGNTFYEAMAHCFLDKDPNTKLNASGVNQNNISYPLLKSLAISGSPVARDLTNGTKKFAEGGHFAYNEAAKESSTTNEGVSGSLRTLTGTSADGALNAVTLIRLDLEDAKIEEANNADLTLLETNILGSQTEEIILPTYENLKTLPADALNFSVNKDISICIPSNFLNIGTRAFYGLQAHLKHVYTTANSATDGTTTDKYDYGTEESPLTGALYGTITLSSNLKKIESYAFNCEEIKDVYVLATTAPECHVNAFSSMMCCANNTLEGLSEANARGYIERDDYAKNKKQGLWMTMLHYPKEVNGVETRHYTDVTRDYSIATTMTDAWGNTIMFPNQHEFLRAYAQGTTGYLWDAWDLERNTQYGFADNGAWNDYNITQAQANTLYNNNANAAKTNAVFYGTSDATTPPSPAPADYTTLKHNNGSTINEDGKDYRGWHQFVLTAYARNSTISYESWSFYQNDDSWWTICLPFSLTKSELTSLFGSDVQLCKLTGVERNITSKKITLRFSKNLLANKEVMTTSTDVHGTITTGTVAANDTVLYRGVPYMIKPSISGSYPNIEVESTSDLGQRIVASKDEVYRQQLLKAGVYQVTTTISYNAEDDDECTIYQWDQSSGTPNYQYTFVGTFYRWYMPQYSYFLGWDTVSKGVYFWWQSEAVARTAAMAWNTFTGVVCPNWTGDHFAKNDGLAGLHWVNSGNSDIVSLTNDSYRTAWDTYIDNHFAKQTAMAFGFDDETSGVGQVVIVQDDATAGDMHVYTMDGQHVGTSLQSLPKGLYIIRNGHSGKGKKIVIK